MKNLLTSKKFQLGFNFFRENSRSRQRGFTLIELLIVVAIIAVLVSVGTFSYSTAMRNARDAQRKSDLKKIALALEKYYTDRGSYPPGSVPPGGTDATYQSTSGVTPWISNLGTYMTAVPVDPKNTASPVSNYQYESFNNGQNYILLTNLENDSDSERRPNSCNEEPYKQAHSGSGPSASYDWCISDPK